MPVSVNRTEVVTSEKRQNADKGVEDPSKECPIHRKSHPLKKCRAFQEKPPEKRRVFLKHWSRTMDIAHRQRAHHQSWRGARDSITHCNLHMYTGVEMRLVDTHVPRSAWSTSIPKVAMTNNSEPMQY